MLWGRGIADRAAPTDPAIVGTMKASSERHTALGSVPTQTTSRSVGLALTAMISGPARPTDCQDLPPSSVLNTPFRLVPHHARPCTNGSALRHVGDPPIPCAGEPAPPLLTPFAKPSAQLAGFALANLTRLGAARRGPE
jgi:hypothetical protein